MFYQTKPIKDIRCNDIADWNDNGDIIVAEELDDNMRFLCAVHELIEWYLCKKARLNDAMVTEWDTTHDTGGDDPKAPYHRQHYYATCIERMVAYKLHVNWDEYEKTIDALLETAREQSAVQSTENPEGKTLSSQEETQQ